MFSDLDRKMLVVPWSLYAGDHTLSDATPGLDMVRTVVANCVLTAVYASAAAATAGTQFVVEILRGATIVATLTSAVPYVAGVVIASTGLEIKLSQGDALTVRVRGVDSDGDDLAGLVIDAALQPLANVGSI